jgi:hypothetical protein
MVTPANENLRAKVPRPTQPVEEQMENLKARLRLAYKAVAAANKGAHGSNKRRYDRKAHLRSFKEGDYVYLCNPAVRPGFSRKFHRFSSGPFRVTAKRSDLNHELLGNKGRKFVVHVNRMKLCRGDVRSETNPVTRRKREPRRAKNKNAREASDAEQDQTAISSYPQVIERTPDCNVPTAPSSAASSPEQVPATPVDRDGNNEVADPSYSPRSSRSAVVDWSTPPLTRSRTRLL